MKERPILFNGPMVRAILEGRKTVTRRACKPQPSASAHTNSANGGPMSGWWETGKDINRCPYGQPGDRLWVRETWRVGKPHDKTAPVDILPPLLAQGKGVTVLYDAGGWKSIGPAGRKEPIYPESQPLPDWAGKGRPSIHMPRSFCRLLLEITAARVERLQEISYQQALAEGIRDAGEGFFDVEENRHLAADPRESFASLWESLNGNGSWDANPWVWVIEFKRVTP